MNPDRHIELIRLIADEFGRRGWRDPGDAAQTLARSLDSGQSSDKAVKAVASRFFVINDISRRDLEVALSDLSLLPVSPRVTDTEVAGRGMVPRRTVAEAARADARHRTWPLLLRMLVAGAFVVAATIAVFALPDAIQWRWLLDHPNRLGIQWGAFAITVLLGGAIVFERWQLLGLAAIAGIFAVIQLFGK